MCWGLEIRVEVAGYSLEQLSLTGRHPPVTSVHYHGYTCRWWATEPGRGSLPRRVRLAPPFPEPRTVPVPQSEL